MKIDRVLMVGSAQVEQGGGEGPGAQSMNQVVRESFRPCIGSYALRETYGKSHECTRFSKAIGAAGSGLE